VEGLNTIKGFNSSTITVGVESLNTINGFNYWWYWWYCWPSLSIFKLLWFLNVILELIEAPNNMHVSCICRPLYFWLYIIFSTHIHTPTPTHPLCLSSHPSWYKRYLTILRDWSQNKACFRSFFPSRKCHVIPS
jgi:hypothetical protein